MQPSMEFGIVQKVFGVHTLNPIVCVQCSCSLMPNTVGLQIIFDFFFNYYFLSCLAICNFETLYIPPFPLTSRYKYKPAVRGIPLCYSAAFFQLSTQSSADMSFKIIKYFLATTVHIFCDWTQGAGSNIHQVYFMSGRYLARAADSAWVLNKQLFPSLLDNWLI